MAKEVGKSEAGYGCGGNMVVKKGMVAKKGCGCGGANSRRVGLVMSCKGDCGDCRRSFGCRDGYGCKEWLYFGRRDMFAQENRSCGGKYVCEEVICFGGRSWLHWRAIVAAENIVVRKSYVWVEGHGCIGC
jgi:hypothetical protein